ncbi:hypothetical protein NE237_028739 [Protea cynaroides]|uniref:Protein EXORDIUM-like 3 n=1 Tax=Protea cynaroides TaxID=273540 RepID=A0A9Q0GPW8_9MAGN|nr:hypothetical protein NE237_028739 [Protea cynaroides]
MASLCLSVYKELRNNAFQFSQQTNMRRGFLRSRCPALLPFAAASLFLLLCLIANPVAGWRPWLNQQANNAANTTAYLEFGGSKKYEGSSNLVHLKYHMGPVLTNNITIHTIWYGRWQRSQKRIIRGFLNSFSDVHAKHPSVAGWWKTVRLYTDQTGANISHNVRLGEEKNDRFYSHGKTFTRLSLQSIIKSAVTSKTRPLPINPKGGLYLLLTSNDVQVQDFCSSICGFHYFTFPSIVGYTLPFAWVGNSATQCSGYCAYPFAVPSYIPGLKPVRSPNGDVGVDGMISVMAHEIAEVATNPLANAWYAGPDSSFPTEVADLCEGIYGTGGGGSYTGQTLEGEDGAAYNMNGGGRRFLVQWVWNPVLNYCSGPNALDQ